MRLPLLVVVAALATPPAMAQMGGASGAASSPGMGGPTSGMAGPNDSGLGLRQDRLDATGRDAPIRPGDGPILGPERALPTSPADRTAIGGSSVGGSGIPGTATGDMTTPR